MKSLLLATTLLIPATALLASTAISPEREAQIRADLTAQGYEVRKIDIEDGKVEVYALKDGERFELILDDANQIVGTDTADGGDDDGAEGDDKDEDGDDS